MSPTWRLGQRTFLRYLLKFATKGPMTQPTGLIHLADAGLNGPLVFSAGSRSQGLCSRAEFRGNGLNFFLRGPFEEISLPGVGFPECFPVQRWYETGHDIDGQGVGLNVIELPKL